MLLCFLLGHLFPPVTSAPNGGVEVDPPLFVCLTVTTPPPSGNTTLLH